jgi:O-succinylbenzoate synthase
VSASNRYWKQDIIHPEVLVTSRGTIPVPDLPGTGYEVDRARVEKLTVRKEMFP